MLLNSRVFFVSRIQETFLAPKTCPGISSSEPLAYTDGVQHPYDARHEVAVHMWRTILEPRVEMGPGLPGTEHDVNLGTRQHRTGLGTTRRRGVTA